MTEEEARGWIAQRYAPCMIQQIERYADLLRVEALQQNLVSTATLDTIWSRHLVDSAQLVPHADEVRGQWVDVGTGAGLPGVVVAILSGRETVLIEPRRLRAAFLDRVVAELALRRCVTLAAKSEQVSLSTPAAVISARAVAALPQLLTSSAHLSDDTTLWLLPKGRSAHSEVAAARQSWHGAFHVKPSITDPYAGIVTAQGVYRR